MLPTEPKTLGRFQIVRELGRGGMGAVYEAIDSDNGTRVALKTIVEADGGLIYRLKWEFRSLARISHRNLVQLYELFFDQEQSKWFFSMELIEGARHFIESVRGQAGALPTEAVVGVSVGVAPNSAAEPPHLSGTIVPRPCAIVDFALLRTQFLQLANGIAALHLHHRMHRDLKPANILVAPDGRVVILDFGMTVEAEGAPQRSLRARPLGATDHQEVIGTPLYMAPEQPAGQKLGPACDWYAFGVLLFEALTGHLPFFHDSSVSTIRHWKETYDAPSPSLYVSDLPDDLIALCRELLSRDPSQRPAGEDIIARLRGSHAPSTDIITLRDTTFVGRQEEMRTLASALDAARGNSTAVCHVSGESGSGKSTLVEKFLVQARAEGALLFTGKCYEQESVPYKAADAVLDSISRHLLALPDDDVDAILPEGINALARMFPVLERVESIRRRGPASSDLVDGRRIAFDALGDLLRRLSAMHTLVIAVDDVQWTDSESATLFANLLRDGAPPKLLVILSYRSEAQVTEGFQHLRNLPQVVNERMLRRDIRVHNLSRQEAESLASALIDDALVNRQRFAEWIAIESGGSALFVRELVRHALLHGSGTPGSVELSSVIMSRVARLPAEERLLAEMAAVAGQPLTLKDLQRAASLEELPLKALSHLRSAQIIGLEGLKSKDTVTISHDRIRETIVSTMAMDRRGQVHRSLATAMEASGSSHPMRIADHFLQCGDNEKAAEYSLRAADQFAHAFAHERAEPLYQQAVRLTNSQDLKVRAYERLIHFYSDLARFEDAYTAARAAMNAIGYRLPSKFIGPLFALDWARLEIRLLGRKPAALLELPTTTDQRIDSAVRILDAVAKAAYQIKPQLCVWVAVRIVNLCLSHGNTRDCAVGYMVYGAIFKGGILGLYKRGYEYGRLALDLVSKYGNDQQDAEVAFVVGYFGTHWRKPSLEAEALWERAFKNGVATGDLFHTGCAAAGLAFGQFIRGAYFDQIAASLSRFESTLRPAHQAEPLGVIQSVRQGINNLRGLTYRTDSFDDQVFKEAEFTRALAQFGSRHFAHCFFIIKAQCMWFWRQRKAALQAIRDGERFLPDSKGTQQEAEHAFYACLIYCDSSDPALLKRAVKLQARMGIWATNCPENFKARHLLLSSRIALARNDRRASGEFASAALIEAQRSSQMHLIACAEILSAMICFSAGDLVRFATSRGNASKALTDWGADAAARHIQNDWNGI